MFSEILIAVLASEGNGTLLDVNPGLIFWTVVTFIILALLLRKIAWKPILSALDQREKSIKESLEKAEIAKQEAQKILDENQANLSRAEEESRKIIEQSKIYSEKLKEQILKEGKEQAEKMISNATAEIERKNIAAFDELKSQVAEISIQAAEKLINEKLDKEIHTKIVNKYINEITKN